MTTKNIWGTLGLVVILAGGFWLLSKAAAPVATTGLTVSTTTPPFEVGTTTKTVAPKAAPAPKGNSQPSFSFGTATTTTAAPLAAFDAKSYTSSSTNPTVGGTANVKKLALVVFNAKGEGLVGTEEIAVVDGRWSYTVSVSLAPGRYTLALGGGLQPVNAVLTVTQ